MLKLWFVLAVISSVFGGPAPQNFFSNELIETEYQERSALPVSSPFYPRRYHGAYPLRPRPLYASPYSRPIAVRRPTAVFRPRPTTTSLLSSLLGIGLLGSLLNRSGDRGRQLELQIEELSEQERSAFVESALTDQAAYYDAVEAYETEVEQANEAARQLEIDASDAHFEPEEIDALLEDAIEARNVNGLIGRAIEFSGEERLNEVIDTVVNEAIENGAKLDVNEDGMVDRNEFYWTFPELDLYEQFGKLDVNNDGFITIDELEN